MIIAMQQHTQRLSMWILIHLNLIKKIKIVILINNRSKGTQKRNEKNIEIIQTMKVQKV